MRNAEIKRVTNETDISLSLLLEGRGNCDVLTGCGFFDHMLALFANQGRFDLRIKCTGDTDVDYHHCVEDIGIALGSAFKAALGDKCAIKRYADITLPMDEALVLCAVDISGRAYCSFDLPVPSQKIKDYDTELTEEFFRAFTNNAGITLHIKKLSGINSHHITEAAFKGFGRALREAVSLDKEFSREIPSTKGVL
ncbi:MAG TPA: imidazoleglycerol-phosphate dehydratase HisB [Clostridiales bacterium]|nr:imidazoleglycerol-phosphate dehydratase HisB [Clostridiales bacterium]